jgi:hypothetical protein
MGGIRRIKSTMFRHLAGGGRAGLVELRDQRQAGKELRDEDAAEASVDTPPRIRATPSFRVEGERHHRWYEAAGERVIKRLNNVYKLRAIRNGTWVPPDIKAALERVEEAA